MDAFPILNRLKCSKTSPIKQVAMTEIWIRFTCDEAHVGGKKKKKAAQLALG